MQEPPPNPSETPPMTRIQRFIAGFIFGSLAWFFNELRFERHFISSLFVSLIFGLFVGGLAALFGKRLFEFLMALITRLS